MSTDIESVGQNVCDELSLLSGAQKVKVKLIRQFCAVINLIRAERASSFVVSAIKSVKIKVCWIAIP